MVRVYFAEVVNIQTGNLELKYSRSFVLEGTQKLTLTETVIVDIENEIQCETAAEAMNVDRSHEC